MSWHKIDFPFPANYDIVKLTYMPPDGLNGAWNLFYGSTKSTKLSVEQGLDNYYDHRDIFDSHSVKYDLVPIWFSNDHKILYCRRKITTSEEVNIISTYPFHTYIWPKGEQETKIHALLLGTLWYMLVFGNRHTFQVCSRFEDFQNPQDLL